jgi:hypothetical protein
MQPLEHTEDLLVVLGVDSDAIVFHAEAPEVVLPRHRYVNLGRTIAAILQAIADQILEELDETRLMAENCGERVACDGGAIFLDGSPAVFYCCLESVVKLDGRKLFLIVARQVGIGEQVRQQLAHTLRSVRYKTNTGFGFVELARAVAFQQELRIAGDHSKRLL